MRRLSPYPRVLSHVPLPALLEEVTARLQGGATAGRPDPSYRFSQSGPSNGPCQGCRNLAHDRESLPLDQRDRACRCAQNVETEPRQQTDRGATGPTSQEPPATRLQVLEDTLRLYAREGRLYLYLVRLGFTHADACLLENRNASWLANYLRARGLDSPGPLAQPPRVCSACCGWGY